MPAFFISKYPQTADELVELLFDPLKMTTYDKAGTGGIRKRFWRRTLSSRQAKWLFDMCLREERIDSLGRRVLLLDDAETPWYSDGMLVLKSNTFNWIIERCDDGKVELKVSLTL